MMKTVRSLWWINGWYSSVITWLVKDDICFRQYLE
jgi:hypothetical protein